MAGGCSRGTKLYKRRCMGLYAMVLYYLGIFPGQDKPKSLVFYWRRYLPLVQLVRFVYTIIFNVISTYVAWGSLTHMIDFVSAILIYAVALVRYGSLYLDRRVVGHMFARLEDLNEPAQLHDETLRRKAEKTETITRCLLKVLLPVYVGMVASSAVSLIVSGLASRTLPFRLWLPYNYSSSPIFEMTLVTINTLTIMDLTMLVFPSFLFVACCIHLIGQYKLLRYKMKNIIHHVDKKLNHPPESDSVSIQVDDVIPSTVEYTIIPLRGAEEQEVDGEVAQGGRKGWSRVRRVTMVRQQSDAGTSENQCGVVTSPTMEELIEDVMEKDGAFTVESEDDQEGDIRGWSRVRKVTMERQQSDVGSSEKQVGEVTSPAMEDLSKDVIESEGVFTVGSGISQGGRRGWLRVRKATMVREHSGSVTSIKKLGGRDTYSAIKELSKDSIESEGVFPVGSGVSQGGRSGWSLVRKVTIDRQQSDTGQSSEKQVGRITSSSMEQLDSKPIDSVSHFSVGSEIAQRVQRGWSCVRKVTMTRQHSGAVISIKKPEGEVSSPTMEQLDSSVIIEGGKESPELNEVLAGSCVRSRGQGWRRMRELVTKRREEQRILETKTQVEMERYLKHCAKHHQTILGLTKDLERVFNATLRFQTVVNFASGVLSLKFTTLAAEYDSMVITSTFTTLAICLEYLFFCWFGNILTDESEKLREAVYGCEWYGASESFKRSIRIMISRTNRPEVVRGGGLSLSMKSFRFICRTGYYLNNVMVKIIHGVKINDKRR